MSNLHIEDLGIEIEKKWEQFSVSGANSSWRIIWTLWSILKEAQLILSDYRTIWNNFSYITIHLFLTKFYYTYCIVFFFLVTAQLSIGSRKFLRKQNKLPIQFCCSFFSSKTYSKKHKLIIGIKMKIYIWKYPSYKT